MLDVTMLRKNLPEVVARLKTRNFDFPVDAFNELEERRKSVQKKTEELQARRNSLSKDIGMMKKNGEDASELLLFRVNLKRSRMNSRKSVKSFTI